MDRMAFAFSCLEALDRAKTPSAALAVLARATRTFGLDHCIVAGVPAPFKKLEPFVLAHNWPSGWFNRYNEQNYIHTDPVIRKLRTTTKPVVWSDAPYDPSADKVGHAVIMEARAFQLNNGLSVPIYTLSGDQAAVSFGGARFDLCAEDKAALHLIAIYGHAKTQDLRLLQKMRPRGTPPRGMLSEREIEILKWVAAGFRSQDIADRLNIGYETVETHVRHACQKLDATSRTQAVAEAIRNKIIP